MYNDSQRPRYVVTHRHDSAQLSHIMGLNCTAPNCTSVKMHFNMMQLLKVQYSVGYSAVQNSTVWDTVQYRAVQCSAV